MTPSPHWVGIGEALSEARSLMREHRIRHLPVLRGGSRLAGVVSDRDLALIRGIVGPRADAIPVEDAMTPEPYAVAPETPLPEVLRTMAARRLGSAVVTVRGAVVGVFTTTDALRALADVLEPPSPPARTKPTRTAPARTKPARTPPARTKPARTPPARTKPARTKPAAVARKQRAPRTPRATPSVRRTATTRRAG